MSARHILEVAPVIPVLVIDEPDTAVDLAKALLDGGLSVLEITLRTPEAFAAIARIKSETDAVVGAGTVNTLEQLEQCVQHKVDFMVSPGLYLPLVAEAQKHNVPYLPGIATATDALTAINAGLDTLKFFPAEQNGGIPMLKALGGPYQDLRFCPTGGIGPHNYLDYLALPEVKCVGGSWVAPRDLVLKKDWQAITRLARNAADRK
jgi:2-dehydro-3-deoxyphosphogluconate aldolase/(4S)-4-hydroxy-2-oxoglutarate aldolase